MILYGSIANHSDTYDQWFLELPYLWSISKNCIKTHPYINLPQFEWGDINKNQFNFYMLEIDNLDKSKVFDLRRNDWKIKCLEFITWYGTGWAYKENFMRDCSPLDSLMYLGNCHALASQGYKWAALNHYDSEAEPIEVWYYVDQYTNPKDDYTITEVSVKEFFDV